MNDVPKPGTDYDQAMKWWNSLRPYEQEYWANSSSGDVVSIWRIALRLKP